MEHVYFDTVVPWNLKCWSTILLLPRVVSNLENSSTCALMSLKSWKTILLVALGVSHLEKNTF